MTKSQNTKNEQQKDLCITSEQLTEQFNNDEIDESKLYYFKQKMSEEIEIGHPFSLNMVRAMDDTYLDWFLIDSVLAPVPTFEEWQASAKYNKHLEEVIKVYEQKDKQATETSIAYGELLEENEKLKELLNKAFVYVHNDCLKNLRVGYTPLSALLIKDIIKALKDYRRKNATEFIYVEDDKD